MFEFETFQEDFCDKREFCSDCPMAHKHDIARRIKSVINWQRWQILFPLLKDYWIK